MNYSWAHFNVWETAPPETRAAMDTKTFALLAKVDDRAKDRVPLSVLEHSRFLGPIPSVVKRLRGSVEDVPREDALSPTPQCTEACHAGLAG